MRKHKMSEPNITTDEAAECLRVLQAARGPIVAAGLARRLRLSGVRETQRRHVRAIIEHLRKEDGSMIVANRAVGYFLTSDRQMWSDYLAGRAIEAKRIFAEVHKRKRMLAYGKGQGVLFEQRIQCGVATCGP